MVSQSLFWGLDCEHVNKNSRFGPFMVVCMLVSVAQYHHFIIVVNAVVVIAKLYLDNSFF